MLALIHQCCPCIEVQGVSPKFLDLDKCDEAESLRARL